MSEGLNAVDQEKVNADATWIPAIVSCRNRYLHLHRPTERERRTGHAIRTQKSGSVEYTLERENEFKLGYVEDKYIRVENSTDVYNETHMPIQKVAVGAISTTRAVDMVEIGIKSTVYRQVSGYPNVNEFTSNDIADDFAKDGQGFQLGTMNAYYPAQPCSV